MRERDLSEIDTIESLEDRQFELAKWFLTSEYEIADLSTIEEWHLRKITKKIIDEEAEIERQSLEIQTEYRLGSYYAEIAYRWLWELYGINVREEKNRKELISRIKFLREQAHNPSLE